jgi:hypothetical protein
MPVGGFQVTPRMALISVDLSNLPPIEIRPSDRPEIELKAIAAPKVEPEPPTLEMKAERNQDYDLELADIEAPHIAPGIDEPKSEQAAADAPEPPEPPVAERAPLVSRFTLLAASLALAAALGGMAGALGALGLTRQGPTPVMAMGRTSLDEIQALKENVVQARVELAALKASIDAGNRNASAQFTKIGERIERVERMQADPAAKLTKAVETLDRMSRADAMAPKDVTGSILPPPPVSGLPKPLGSVDGWILRDVRRGTALIEGRMGIIEVDQGDVVPGLGRIDAIRKQADGRWVVVTTRGLIMTVR